MGFRSFWRLRAIYASRKSVALLLALLISFACIGMLVRYSVLQPLDVHVTHELQERVGVLPTALMMTATFFGNTLTVVILAAIVSLLLAVRGHVRASIFVVLTLLAVPTDMLLKQIWERARPDANLVQVLVNRTGYSFPSGHALVSTSFYGGLSILAWIHLRSYRTRKGVALGMALIPGVVAISRVYLGAHWVSDVLGGVVFGLALLVGLTQWYRSKPSKIARPIPDVQPQPPPSSPSSSAS